MEEGIPTFISIFIGAAIFSVSDWWFIGCGYSTSHRDAMKHQR